MLVDLDYKIDRRCKAVDTANINFDKQNFDIENFEINK